MKGIIFTELFEMVEERFGFTVLDKVIQSASSENKGIYTSVGNYDDKEIIELVRCLSLETKISESEILKDFGKYAFKKFYYSHEHLLTNLKNAFDFFQVVDSYIHKEVKKLHTGSIPPVVKVTKRTIDHIEMIYQSNRAMSDLAEGLIEGCLDFYNEPALIKKEQLNPEGTEVLFTISKIYGRD